MQEEMLQIEREKLCRVMQDEVSSPQSLFYLHNYFALSMRPLYIQYVCLEYFCNVSL